MLQRLSLVLLFLMCHLSMPAQTDDEIVVDYDFLSSLALPVLDIHTIDGEMPTCEFITEDGGNRKSITNQTEVPGRFVMTLKGDTLYDSDEYKVNKRGITIKIRGNTSAYYQNPSYKIKLQQKADLLMRDNPIYKDKNWVLLRTGARPHTLIGLFVNQQLHMQWTPCYQLVNVMLNDDYRGLYYLIENVRRSVGRLNISERGFILEYDAYYWNADYYIPSLYPDYMNWTFKYPDATDFVEEEELYIKQQLYEMERAMMRGGYKDYVDLVSFAKWQLGQDILGQGDSWGSNIYLTKFDNTSDSKFMMANMWDFDWIMNIPYDTFPKSHTNRFVFLSGRMFHSSPDLLAEYVHQWHLLMDEGFAEHIQQFIDSLDLSPLKADINASIQLTNQRWPYNFPLIDSYLQPARDWFNQRLEWMNDTIRVLEQQLVETSLPALVADDSTPANVVYYDLSGQRRHTPLRGVNVVVMPNGTRRKLLQR